MDRIDRIIHDPSYVEHINRISLLEEDRIYCHHDMVHFLDVARIATILAFEEKLTIKRDIIYAAALLHDIGRDEQYNSGIEHEKASCLIAPSILERAGYNSDEILLISEAIREHGNEKIKSQSNLIGIIYRADKLSRKCYMCSAADTCHKREDKRNKRIVY